MNDTKICLLGGDTRQSSLARYLARYGYETAVWGIPFSAEDKSAPSSPPDFVGVKCSDPASAVTGSRAVILPLPASVDGVRVHCLPPSDGAEFHTDLRLTELMEMLPLGTLLLAGKPSDVLKSMARNANVKLIDYYDCEEVQIKNAIPTAEGAIAIAMEGLPITLFGAEAVILGYGRIGQRLAAVLHALGAHVTVAARSQHDLTWASVAGYNAADLNTFLHSPSKPDVIFNTIPAPILTKDVLGALPASTILIELASAPGGIDPTAAKNAVQRILRAPSLPGRVAPVSAGKILFETVVRILAEEGVTPK